MNQSRQFHDPSFSKLTPLVAGLARREKTVLVVLIIDESGSMQTRANAVRESVGQMIDQLSKSEDDRQYFICLIAFANEAKIMQLFQHVATAEKEFHYQPANRTRLYSTVYETLGMIMYGLDEVADDLAEDLQITVAVFSDGDDNESKAGDLTNLQETCRRARQTSLNWQLQTFGIGIDGPRLAEIMGFDLDHALTVEASSRGVTEAMNASTSMTMSTAMPDYLRDQLQKDDQTNQADSNDNNENPSP